MATTVLIKASDLLTTLRDWANGRFVQQVEGKGLSANDFTDALLTKLNGIATGAEVNTIVGVQVNGTDLTIDANTRKVNINLSSYATTEAVAEAIASAITATYQPHGSKAASELTSSLLVAGNLGYVYNISTALEITSSNVGLFTDVSVGDKFPAGTNVAIVNVGTTAEPSYKFDVLAGFIDLSAYYVYPSGGIPATDLATAVQTSLGKADSAYQKPTGGIPDTDLSSGVQTSLGKADSAYQLPSGGIPATDLATAVQTSLGKADSAYQKPSGGIPKADLASGVQSSLDKADSALQAHQTIKIDGVTGASSNRYGTCSTAAATVAKEVSITTGTFTLEAGATVRVKFANANTASTPTLNVNSTGAKNIYSQGVQITTGNNKGLLKGVCTFIYDGTQWHILGGAVVSIDDIQDLSFMTSAEALEILNATT